MKKKHLEEDELSVREIKAMENESRLAKTTVVAFCTGTRVTRNASIISFSVTFGSNRTLESKCVHQNSVVTSHLRNTEGKQEHHNKMEATMQHCRRNEETDQD